MDPDDDRALARIRKRTGWTASAAIKKGLRVLERDLESENEVDAWALYESLAIGPEPKAIGPSNKVSETVRDAIRRKHNR